MTKPQSRRADEIFSIGDLVAATKSSLAQGLVITKHPFLPCGEIVGFSRDRKMIRVRQHGKNKSALFHPDFWEKVEIRRTHDD